MSKLVGFKKFVSKKNSKTYCMASIVSELSVRDLENGAVGQKVDVIFLPDDQVDFLKPDDIGKEIFCNYNVDNGRAFLQSVSIK